MGIILLYLKKECYFALYIIQVYILVSRRIRPNGSIWALNKKICQQLDSVTNPTCPLTRPIGRDKETRINVTANYIPPSAPHQMFSPISISRTPFRCKSFAAQASPIMWPP